MSFVGCAVVDNVFKALHGETAASADTMLLAVPRCIGMVRVVCPWLLAVFRGALGDGRCFFHDAFPCFFFGKKSLIQSFDNSGICFHSIASVCSRRNLLNADSLKHHTPLPVPRFSPRSHPRSIHCRTMASLQLSPMAMLDTVYPSLSNALDALDILICTHLLLIAPSLRWRFSAISAAVLLEAYSRRNFSSLSVHVLCRFIFSSVDHLVRITFGMPVCSTI